MKIKDFYFLVMLLSAILWASAAFSALASKENRNSEIKKKTPRAAHQIVPGFSSKNYIDFLNAVAPVDDPHALYDGTSACIERLRIHDHYHYRAIVGQEQLLMIDLLSAMRYCNWEENGRNAADREVTEHGAYDLESDTVIINAQAKYFVEASSAQIDCCLHCNKNTFSIVTASIKNGGEKSGEALTEGTLLDDLVGEVATMGLLGVGAAEGMRQRNTPEIGTREELPTREEIATEETTMSLLDKSSKTETAALFSKPHFQQEKEKTATTIQELIKKNSVQNAEAHASLYADYYKKADVKWDELHEAWKKRTTAQREKQDSSTLQDQAQKVLK